jgi:hypothetical protein
MVYHQQSAKLMSCSAWFCSASFVVALFLPLILCLCLGASSKVVAICLFWYFVGVGLFAATLMFLMFVQASFSLYSARDEVRSLLKSWVERDGICFLGCRMFLIPVVYHLSVEDQRGIKRRGWALVTGKFATTPEFIPITVRYCLLWPVAGHAKASTTHASIGLWDDWLDRQLEA